MSVQYSEVLRLYIPFNPGSPLLSAGAAASDIVALCRAVCIRLLALQEHTLRASTHAHLDLRAHAWRSLITDRTFCGGGAFKFVNNCFISDPRTVMGAQVSCSAKMTQMGSYLITKTLTLRNGLRGLLIYKKRTRIMNAVSVNKLKRRMASPFNI